MASHSARISVSRPFYAEYAAAFDLLVDDPVEPWVDAVHDRLTAAGWLSAKVLDAGCGTGRHAEALAAKGHHVDLADAAPDLLAQARQRNPSARVMQVDLCALASAGEYQAVTCRGVLNDMISDRERNAALSSFAAALAPDGLLMLDVREPGGSQRRADGVPRSRTVDLGPVGRLTFTATVTWRSGRLHVHEQHDLRPPDRPVERRSFAFVMRPWSERELETRLAAAGFYRTEIGPSPGRTSGDRLFVSARRRPVG